MKTMFEHMITVIVMVIMLFIFTSIVMTEVQIVGARRVHASAINQIQSSYYAVDINALNDKLHETYPNWNLSSSLIESVNTRKDYKVKLDYEIMIPVFNIKKKGMIEGYAR